MTEARTAAWRLRAWFWAGVCLAAAAPATAMEFHRAGDTLILSGPVISSDWPRLNQALDSGEIKLLVLHESAGGDLWTGLRAGERIRELGLSTAVSGRCASSCALMFLGGAQRHFSDGTSLQRARLGLHGPHSRATKSVSTGNGAKVGYFIGQMTGGKYPADLLRRTIEIAHYRDIIYVHHPAVKSSAQRARGVVECLRPPAGEPRCEAIPGHDAESIGAITGTAVLKLSAQARQVIEGLGTRDNPGGEDGAMEERQ